MDLSPFFDPCISQVLPDLPFADYQTMPGINSSLLKEPTTYEMLCKLESMAALPIETQQLLEYKGGDASAAMRAVQELRGRSVPRNFVVKGATPDSGAKITAKQEELLNSLGDEPVDAREFNAAVLNKCLTYGWAKLIVREVVEAGLKEETKAARAYALAVGDATHKAILEPHLFDSDQWHKHWQLSPTKSLVSELAKQTQAEDPTRRLITSEIVDVARRCRDAVWKHKKAASLLMEKGASEVSMQVWDEEMGVIRKARFDRLPFNREAGIVDVKTTHGSLLTYPFRSTVYQYGYHTQGGFYLDTESLLYLSDPRPAYYIIAVTNEEPFIARVFELFGAVPEASLIEKGRDIYQERLAAFVLAYHENKFSAYEDEDAQLLTA